MLRTAAVVALAVMLAGCSKFQRGQGPFAPKPKPRTDIPPPYGATAPKPLGNQSPLGMASADPTPSHLPEDPSLVPPKPGIVQVSGVNPNAPRAPDQTPAAKNLATLKTLVTTSATAWRAVTTFEATLTRHELNPQGKMNNEVLLFQLRREPMSLYTRNLDEANKGREVVYFPAKYGDTMHVKLGKSDPGEGWTKSISPDDKRVQEKARYSIREAGLGRAVDSLVAWTTWMEAGKVPTDSLIYGGEVKRTEYPYALVCVTHRLRPGDDPLFPSGGVRRYFLDMRANSPSFGLPVLIFATDAQGKEAEYYLFERVKSPAGLTDTDFNPDRLKRK